MPKRRTPRQKAAARRNLEKARAVRKAQLRINALKTLVGAVDSPLPVPTGKNVLVLHRTTQKAANAILREGFRPTQHNVPYTNARDGAFLYGVLPATVNNWKGYGEAVVGVKVPRRKVKTDKSMSTYYPAPVRVSIKDLQGRRFRQFKPGKAAKRQKPSAPTNSQIVRYFT